MGKSVLSGVPQGSVLVQLKLGLRSPQWYSHLTTMISSPAHMVTLLFMNTLSNPVQNWQIPPQLIVDGKISNKSNQL